MFNIDPENRPRFPKKKPDRVPLPSFFRGGKCETSGEYQEKEQQKHPKDGVIDFFWRTPELWGLKTREMMPEGKIAVYRA